jgi:hypothetical protein
MIGESGGSRVFDEGGKNRPFSAKIPVMALPKAAV